MLGPGVMGHIRTNSEVWDLEGVYDDFLFYLWFVLLGISARLFQHFGPKNSFWRKLEWKARLVQHKMQLFGKICVLAKAENAQTIMDIWRSILEKVHACSQLSVGLFKQLPNYPSIKLTHASHLFSLLYPLRATTNTAPPNYHRSTTTTHFNIW